LARSVLVLGDLNLDLSFLLTQFPSEGGDSSAQELRWGAGGGGLNAAVGFARLGAGVRLLGRVGQDPWAEPLLQLLAAEAVDLSALQRDPQRASGLCSVAVSPGGQRTFFAHRGANLALDPSAVGPALLQGQSLIYLSSHALLEGPQRAATQRLAKLAAAAGLPLALDLGLPTLARCPQLIEELLPQLWLLSLNEDELAALRPDKRPGAALQDLHARGVGCVALKLGARGCRLLRGAEEIELAPPPVTVVDTTACGDAFAAGLCWALLQGASLHEGARLANCMGAATATRLGAAEALPSRADLEAALPAELAWLLSPIPAP